MAETKIEWAFKDRLRFLSKVDMTNGCWNWAGATTKGGYGVFVHPDGHHTTAHRAAYELTYGDIPKDLVVDHLCRNRLCVNPDHLEAVTNRENTVRGLKGNLPTHCKRGHLWTEENTLYNSNGRRQCRECRRARDRGRRDVEYWRNYRLKRKRKFHGQTH